MNIIGIDLAKNIFHVCVMNRAGRVLRRKKLSRGQLLDYVLQQGVGIVALEACGGSHYWARVFKSHGYEVRIMSAQFVKPFVKSNKNDNLDAEAICEAASRPQMRFVSMRTSEQQDIQNLHRIRERLVRQRTALSNEIRGFLLEYGIVVPRGIAHIRSKLPTLVEAHREEQSALWHQTFVGLYEEFCAIDERIKCYQTRLGLFAREQEDCKRLMEVPGVGMLTATAIVAAVGNAKAFKNGRQFAAWLGLTPRQHSTGGKVRLGGISKRGDKYLRKLLIQGAWSIANAAVKKRNHKEPHKRQVDITARWLFALASRRGDKRAIVALANKTARRIWVVLNGKDFKQPEELLALAA